MKKISPLLEKSKLVNTCKKTLVGYSVIFTFMSILIFGLFFYSNERSLVWAADGLSQHCLVLAYYGEYLRTILRNIFVEHTFVIPMFDFSIGYGSDIVSTLHYYAIGDPINILAVFFSKENIEWLYSFLVIFRMYVAGFTFCLYMSTKKSNASAVVTGAISFVFVGYSFYAGVRHPFFLTGMMYCPLIFYGIDKILKGKSPLLYISALALVVSANFYSAYMVCIFMVIYAIITYIFVYRKEGVKHFFTTVGKFALFTVNGMLIPMVIFLPQIYNTLAVDRLNVDNMVKLFYPASYYTGMLDAVTNVTNIRYWLALGLSGISVLGLLTVIVKIKKYKILVTGLFVGIIFMLFPFFGHALNGFTYVTNRWCWIIVFIASAALTFAYDELFEMSDKDKKFVFVAVAVYITAVMLIQRSRSELTMIMLLFMVAGLFIAFSHEKLFKSKRTAQRVVSVLVAVSSFIQALYIFSYKESAYVDEFMMVDATYDYMVVNTPSYALKEYSDDLEFYRYDSYKSYDNYASNESLMNDMNSTQFFFSITNPHVSSFLQEVGLNQFFEQRYSNLDNRVILQYLTGSKYNFNGNRLFKIGYYNSTDLDYDFKDRVSVNAKGNDAGFVKGTTGRDVESSDTFVLYETKHYLPMGYTYDVIMPRDEYEKLSPVEKQNVLLQAAVVDSVTDLPAAEIRDDVTRFDVFDYIGKTEGVTIEDNAIVVTDKEATLTFDVPVVDGAEVYLEAVNLNVEFNSYYDAVDAKIEDSLKDISTDDEEARLDLLSSKRLARSKFFYTDPETAQISAASEITGHAGSIVYYTPANSFYSGLDTYVLYLGYSMENELLDEPIESNQIKIKFKDAGRYTFDSLNICYQELGDVKSDVAVRKEDILENVEITNSENTVKGTISLDETKILATQIPYSEGWTVTVDGEEAELLNVNTMFCGVLLDAGEHTVEFNYVTPNAKIAVALTSAGMFMFIVTAVVWGRKKKKVSNEVSTDTDKTE